MTWRHSDTLGAAKSSPEPMKPKRLALVGVGPMAALHAQAIAEVDGLQIDVCMSRDPERAADFAARHGLPRSLPLSDLAEAPDVDGFWIVAPAEAMASVATTFAGYGLPMFLEKPVGLSLEETRGVRQAIATPTMVGLNRRFYEVIQRGLALVEAAGGVRAVEVHMPEDLAGAASANSAAVKAAWPFANSVHLIDLFRLFGGEPASVTTRNQVISVEDRAFAGMIEFEHGAGGLFSAQWYAPGGWRVSVYAKDLTLQFQPIEQLTIIRRPRAQEVITASGRDARLKPGLFGQAQAFRDLLNTGRLEKPGADLADYERTVALVKALTAPNLRGSDRPLPPPHGAGESPVSAPSSPTIGARHRAQGSGRRIPRR